MAYVFTAWMTVPALGLVLDALGERRGVSQTRATWTFLLHSLGAVILGLSALAWYDYAVIEDFGEMTERWVWMARAGCVAGVVVIACAWIPVWRKRGNDR